MMYLLAILLPPVAVLMCGRPVLAVLNLLLTLLLWVPGAVHAVLVVHNTKEDRRHRSLLKAVKRGGPAAAIARG